MVALHELPLAPPIADWCRLAALGDVATLAQRHGHDRAGSVPPGRGGRLGVVGIRGQGPEAATGTEAERGSRDLLRLVGIGGAVEESGQAHEISASRRRAQPDARQPRDVGSQGAHRSDRLARELIEP